MNLHEAIENGDTETAKRLIEEGENLFCTKPLQVTPAHVAAEKGNIEILELINNYGGPIYYTSCQRFTHMKHSDMGKQIKIYSPRNCYLL